ncbi:tRNA (guanine(10)-N(2))-dimethyltransferase [Methanocaldococcus indicus]|uniref:tRNA (guanine(10)-N(2))-dimethyltransferase n=1 Tax=Methanocaldococcus indicus TaxID=213231 RepID=UPI003C6D590B
MLIEEGKISFNVPDNISVTKKDEVFYNPKMRTGRDFAVCVVDAFLEIYHKEDSALIADALSGSGVRGLRYAKEIESKDVKVYLNDINPKAYKKILENIEINNLKDKTEVFNEDANLFLNRFFRGFNVVDIDPFGSPSVYIDSALRALKPKNSLLCLTATDTAALCGRAVKSCLRKYLAYPLLTKDCHELALRILVGYCLRVATKYELYLTPVLAHATDHYVRVYLKVDRGAKKADKAFKDLGYIKDVDGEKIINSFEDGYNKEFKGPFYIKNLYDKKVVERALELSEERGFERAYKILSIINEEKEIDKVGCYDTHLLGKVLKISVPPINTLIEKLKNKGYKVSRTHYNPRGIKTDASLTELKKLLCEEL